MFRVKMEAGSGKKMMKTGKKGNWEKKRVETSQNKMELNDTKGYRKHEIKTALYPSPTLASPNAIFTSSRYLHCIQQE